jgi:apolipoprotein D and lipocalin family protein
VRRVLIQILCAWSLLGIMQAQKDSLEVVPDVDFSQYAGKWYEIARLPNSFQKHCVGNVTATYMVQPDGRIRVINECRTEDGVDKAEGVARLADENGPQSKLKVRFAPSILSFLPWVWGDYWIVELAPDYSYALVGEPSRKYLWFLSRKPVIDEALYERLVEQAREKGFDVTRLIRTRQD